MPERMDGQPLHTDMSTRCRGTCHCGRIAFTVEGTPSRVSTCNCSICTKTGFLHWIVDAGQVTLAPDWQDLSAYIWGTGIARLFFCPVCGVAPLRRPRLHPEKIGINVRCLEGVDIAGLLARAVPVDGRSLPLPGEDGQEGADVPR